MDQFDFECIVKLIQTGAPALAERLIGSLVKLVESEASLRLQLKGKEEKDGL